MRNRRTAKERKTSLNQFPEAGVYALLVSVVDSCLIRIGGLGVLPFMRGTYVYVGSARNGLVPRIVRHLRGRKRKRWHVDYLTCVRVAHVASVVATATQDDIECKLSRAVEMKTQPTAAVKGFGSSDCKTCSSHLYYFRDISPGIVLQRIRRVFRNLHADSGRVGVAVFQ